MFLEQVYRESFVLFVSCAIPYNHESIRRGMSFVTRKITNTAARIASGSEEILELGNLDGARDWGHAPEYVEGMTRIIEHERPDSFILATGTMTSVREFVSAAFESLGMKLEFEGKGISEVGVVSATGQIVLRVNELFFWPSDPSRLTGDPSKVANELGWKAGLTGGCVAARMAGEEVELLAKR